MNKRNNECVSQKDNQNNMCFEAVASMAAKPTNVELVTVSKQVKTGEDCVSKHNKTLHTLASSLHTQCVVQQWGGETC